MPVAPVVVNVTKPIGVLIHTSGVPLAALTVFSIIIETIIVSLTEQPPPEGSNTYSKSPGVDESIVAGVQLP